MLKEYGRLSNWHYSLTDIQNRGIWLGLYTAYLTQSLKAWGQRNFILLKNSLQFKIISQRKEQDQPMVEARDLRVIWPSKDPYNARVEHSLQATSQQTAMPVPCMLIKMTAFWFCKDASGSVVGWAVDLSTNFLCSRIHLKSARTISSAHNSTRPLDGTHLRISKKRHSSNFMRPRSRRNELPMLES